MVLAIVVATLSSVAGASPLITMRTEEHFVDALSPVISAACGFSVVGVIDVTEFDLAVLNRSGDVFRELDLVAHVTETVFAPSSGKSFVFPVVESFHYSYPDGTDVGDPAVVTIDGFVRKLPGGPADAGHVVYGNGVIVAVDQNGFPRVQFGQPTSVVGNRVDPAQAIATVCAALSP